MKNLLSITLLILISGCATTNKINWSNSFWGTIESEEAYLYKSRGLTAIVEKELKRGSIVFFHTRHGDFQEVYISNPKLISKELRYKYRYFLYKPKYQKLNYKYKKNIASLYEIPFDPNRTYLNGERGGCYYINKHGNKTYVSRSYCSAAATKKTTPTYKPRTTNKSSSNCRTVQCSGRTKKGSRCKNKTTKCSGRCHLH